MLQLETFKTVAQPAYIIITPEVEEIGHKGYTGNENEFLEFLAKGAK